MLKKMLFIFNPQTGGGRLKSKLVEMLCKFSAAGYRVTVCPTAGMGDARRIASEAEEYDLIVCCGGDGTLNEVVDGLMRRDKPHVLGYIPGGTTNDFASSLTLPKGNLLVAAERVLAPKKVFHCDVGSFNQRAFTYVAAFGAFTDVPYTTPQKFKNVLGYFAYILEAVQRLPSLRASRVSVECDGECFEDDFLFGMVTNSSSVAGFSFPNKDKVRLDDGLFEVLLVRRPQNLQDLGALSGALLAKNISSPSLAALRAKNIRVEAREPVSWTLDGEYGGCMTQAEIQVRHRALHICI